jgi:biotin synthase
MAERWIMMFDESLPKKIRVSVGSAAILGLTKDLLDVNPTTIYLLTYRLGKCLANCAFCPQSRESGARSDMLSRVVWPVFPTEDVILRIAEAFEKEKIKRVCIQALNYPGVQNDLIGLAKKVRSVSHVPISVSCQPLNSKDMIRLFHVGVNRVSIALDAVTEEIFSKRKGVFMDSPYTWEGHFKALEEAVNVFGRGSVTTHLIAGLGEKEEDFVYMIQKCFDLGIYPAVFAFTPVPGTFMSNHPRPSLSSYRRIQLAHYLVTKGIKRYENMTFNDGCLVQFGLSTEELIKIVRTGEPFKTSGCSGCNRPYYNEEPRGPIYNYPRNLTPEEISEIEKQMELANKF